MVKIECLSDYLTVDGWKRDWENTKTDFNNAYQGRRELSDNVSNELGGIATGMMYISVGVCFITLGSDYYIPGALFFLAGALSSFGKDEY